MTNDEFRMEAECRLDGLYSIRHLALHGDEHRDFHS
jgi:hypothetical protein